MFFRVVIGVCAAALLGGARGEAQGAGGGWKAGAAKVNITPTVRMWMSGYAARTKPAEGKLTDLWAKALVLEDPTGRRGVLVTMDLVGIDRPLSQEVCASIQKAHGIPRAAIILSVSHTHCGPVVGSNLGVMFDLDTTQQALVREYTTTLRRKLIDVVGVAFTKLEPVKLTWGIGRATFAVNRRNNVEKEVPQTR